ncbi:hypothetical protein BJP35_3271 [Enterobacter sp. J49]|nr:hypothetical protein BJP35_3271 [Enterobacter sp. J49]SAC28533.1 Uncharacterised protein [Enterobacter ludwigii]
MCCHDVRIILNDDFITPKLCQEINITLTLRLKI